MRWQTDPLARRRASHDALRRPRGHQQPVLHGRPRRHHGADRSLTAPARRPSSTASPASTSRPRDASRWPARASRPTRPMSSALTASGTRHGKTRPDGRHLPPRADAGPRDLLEGPGGPHLPEHPPVHRHDGAREPADRPAQPADDRLRLDVPRRARDRRLQGAREARRSKRPTFWLEADRPSRPRRRPRPATCPTATSAGWRSPGPCAPTRCCSASTSRQPA